MISGGKGSAVVEEVESVENAMSSSPKHRWFRYNLRSVLVATTLMAVYLGIWTSSARRQRASTNAIVALGGSVTYDFQATTGRFVVDAVPVGPAWLRSILGRDWFDSVHGVGLYDADGATDELIAVSLHGVPDTRSLQLDRSNAGFETMAIVSKMKSLRNLMLHDTSVDDRGLQSLCRLSNLENLDLRGTRATEKGIRMLRAALPNCTITADWP